MIHAFAALDDSPIVKDWEYKPRDLQPEDIELEIVACGICHSDCHQLLQEWDTTKRRPLVPGHEIVGIVIRKGDRAVHSLGARVSVGTLVGCCFNCDECKSGQENYCKLAVDTYTGTHEITNTRTHGGFAERMIVDSRFAFSIPDSLPNTTAAPLMCAGATVYSPLNRYCTSKTKVGIVGIGGLGHLALQFAKAMNISHILAITTSLDKALEAKNLGATHVCVSNKEKDMKANQNSVDFLLVTVSADLKWKDYIKLLRVGGTLCLVGLPPSNKMDLNCFQIVGRRIHICGSNTAGLQEIQNMLSLAAEKNIRAQVELFPLSAHGANDAVQRVLKNLPRYRCVMIKENGKL